MMATAILLWILAILCIVIGILGTILPALPGAPLIFVGFLLHAWIYDFVRISWFTIALLAVLALLTLVVDIVASALGAKRVGASTWALLGAAVGSIVGIFLGILGMLVGPFVGAAAGELYAKQDLLVAGKVGLATWLGMLLGTVVKIGIVFSMVAIYATATIF